MRSSILDTLTGEQKDQLYDWLLQMPVPQVARKLAQPAPEGFDIKIHITTLQRFKNRRWAEAAADQLEAAKTAAACSTDDATLDSAIASTLKRHLFERASAPDATTADLALLARFVHRNEKLKLEVERVQISRERLAQNNRRLDILDRGVQIRAETLAFRREESARRAARTDNSKSKNNNSELASQSDHLGPYATNLDDVSERLRIQFGVSQEEWARRTALDDVSETQASPQPQEQSSPSTVMQPSTIQ